MRQLQQEVGREERIGKAANLDGEVLTHYHSAVMGTRNHCRVTATVSCFNHMFWHELAVVGHNLSLLKCILYSLSIQKAEQNVKMLFWSPGDVLRLREAEIYYNQEQKTREGLFAMNEQELQQWFANNTSVLETAYLLAKEPWQQSGVGLRTPRSAQDWEVLRRPIADCVTSSESFLDIGCANGYLLECLLRWTQERGLHIDTAWISPVNWLL